MTYRSTTEGSRDAEAFALIFAIPLLIIIAFLLVLGNVIAEKNYNEAKESGEWIVGEARLVNSDYKAEPDLSGEIRKIYTHVFTYIAPDDNVYYHFEKDDSMVKVRDSYEILMKKNRYTEIKIKPSDLTGNGWKYIAAIVCLVITIAPIVRLIFLWNTAPNWKTKYDL